MPRKKLTIMDFKFSLDNTVKINTTHRMKNCPLNIISINFTENEEKIYKRFILHTENEEILWDFIDKLNVVLNSINIQKINKTKVKVKREKKNPETPENIEEDNLWVNMPEFQVNENIYDCVSVQLEIETIDNPLYILLINKFYETFNIILWPKIISFWYPERPDNLSLIKDKMYESSLPIVNKYPIYIISKGRYEKRYTSKYLEWCKIDYKIVIEPQEFNDYAKYIDKSKILILPNEYLNKNQGSIPARNFVWKHSKENNHKRHWILDDNITSYKRFMYSQKVIVQGACVFRIVEDFVDRFTNVKMAGHNYTMFAVTTNTGLQPITMNTRIYSSILLSNDIFPEYQWRGKYNEDTDLSLRILKAGYPTILFNCFLADKLKTLTQKGGNTDSIYTEKDGVLLKAQSIVEQHKDVAKIISRFGRPHHYVNYSAFKNLKPILIEGIKSEPGNLVNEYGLRLVKKATDCLNDINAMIEDTNEQEKEKEKEKEKEDTNKCDTVNSETSADTIINQQIIKGILSEILIIKNKLTQIEDICNKNLNK
jgi:hypothetical protein